MSPDRPDWQAQFMQLALLEAEKAAELGEVPVGAIVVSGSGEILGAAGNRSVSLKDPTGHAEILALRQAAEKVSNYRLSDCSIYVTLEPCIMCVGALVHARVRHIFFAAEDPKTGALINKYAIGSDGLLNHKFDIEFGLGAEKSSHMLREFFRKRR